MNHVPSRIAREEEGVKEEEEEVRNASNLEGSSKRGVGAAREVAMLRSGVLARREAGRRVRSVGARSILWAQVLYRCARVVVQVMADGRWQWWW